MIYKNISENEFINEFVGSETTRQYVYNFSREGLKALYEHLSELENLELDVIALCCEFAEYDSYDELFADYSQYATLEDIESDTTVIELDSGGFIIQQF